MEIKTGIMNSPATAAIVIVILLAIILFTVIKNGKERKKLEQKLNEDYDKPHPTGSDIDTEDNKV